MQFALEAQASEINDFFMRLPFLLLRTLRAAPGTGSQ